MGRRLLRSRESQGSDPGRSHHYHHYCLWPPLERDCATCKNSPHIPILGQPFKLSLGVTHSPFLRPPRWLRRPPRERKIPGSNPAYAGIFSGSSSTSDLKTGYLPGAWRYRVSAGTGWPGVSILRLGEMESLVCNFCLSVTARRIV